MAPSSRKLLLTGLWACAACSFEPAHLDRQQCSGHPCGDSVVSVDGGAGGDPVGGSGDASALGDGVGAGDPAFFGDAQGPQQFFHLVASAPLLTGVCSGPIWVSVVSELRRPEAALTALTATLETQGLTLYDGPGCTNSFGPSMDFAAGGRSAAVWVQSSADGLARLAVTPTLDAEPLAIPSVTVLPFDAGWQHTCVSKADGGVGCWGNNASGALGNGTLADALVPGSVINSWPASRVLALGADHSCALTETREIYCTGDNTNGQLADGTTDPRDLPAKVTGLTSIVSISSFDRHVCVVNQTGGVACWGQGDSGQVGQGSQDPAVTAPRSVALPVTVAAAAVAVGRAHSCVLTRGGRVFCWGDNAFGQLGDDTTVGRSEPAVIPELRGVVQLAAGADHTCALLSDRTVRCWGLADLWRFGSASGNQPTPIAMAGASAVVQVAAGERFTCVTLADRTVQCVGNNLDGETGHGSRGIGGAPLAPVVDLSGALWVGTGWSHACASTGAALYCWGKNDRGEIGNGELNHVRVPKAVGSLDGVMAVSVGQGGGRERHSCAVLSTGATYCWGSNNHGQLGNNSTTDSPGPILVDTGSDVFVEIAAVNESTCSIDNAGGAWCWGDDDDGVLGVAEGVGQMLKPIAVTTVTGMRRITRGTDHVCARASTGDALCWGLNADGQLGNGVTTASDTPVAPVFSGNALDLAAGGEHTCTYVPIEGSAARQVLCVGNNTFGQLGDGGTADSLDPVPAAMPGDVSPELVAVGVHTSCAVLVDGRVACWGDNHDGQLGDGTKVDRVEPVEVVDSGGTVLSGIIAVSVGRDHACAIRDNGDATHDLLCWGSNEYGQLGLGGVIDRLRAHELSIDWTPDRVSAGLYGTCATSKEGPLYCWGDNRFGQAGVGRFGSEATPVSIPVPN